MKNSELKRFEFNHTFLKKRFSRGRNQFEAFKKVLPKKLIGLPLLIKFREVFPNCRKTSKPISLWKYQDPRVFIKMCKLGEIKYG